MYKLMCMVSVGEINIPILVVNVQSFTHIIYPGHTTGKIDGSNKHKLNIPEQITAPIVGIGFVAMLIRVQQASRVLCEY